MEVLAQDLSRWRRGIALPRQAEERKQKEKTFSGKKSLLKLLHNQNEIYCFAKKLNCMGTNEEKILKTKIFPESKDISETKGNIYFS